MRRFGLFVLLLALPPAPNGWARLPDAPLANVRSTAPVTTKTADATSDDNWKICADQWVNLIDGIGDKSEAATEFRVLMSMKCGAKTKKGVTFGANSPSGGPTAEEAVEILRRAFPRAKTAAAQRRVRDLIAMAQARSDYPKTASIPAPGAAN